MFLAGTAVAQPAPRSYAVFSMVGDRLTVVTHAPSVGSGIDRNVRNEVPLPDDTFDVSAVLAARAAIRDAEPGAKTDLFAPRDAALYALQDRLADGDDSARPLAEALREAVQQSGATHLLLIAKFRGEARIPFADGAIGTGQLRGIGFYVDPVLESHNTETGVHSTGFFAPYAHLRITLFEAAGLKPLGEEIARVAQPFGTARSKTAVVPWDALSAAQKVAALKSVVSEAVQESVGKLLARR